MKKNFLHLLAILAFIQLATAYTAKAQDGLPNPELNGLQYQQESSSYDDKPLIFESDLKSNVKIVRDSTSSRTPVRSKSSNNSTFSGETRKTTPAKAGDDALNHNFLYYIIQKFKTSDLIEE